MTIDNWFKHNRLNPKRAGTYNFRENSLIRGRQVGVGWRSR